MSAFDALKPKHQAFVLAFLDCFNASQAYRVAGYAANGANCNSSALMAKHNIAAAIAELMDSHGISPERIKSALAEIAFDKEGEKSLDRISALKELVRVRGMAIERHQVSFGPDALSELSEKDLWARAHASASEVRR